MTRVLICIVFLTTLFSLKSTAQTDLRKHHSNLSYIRLGTILPQNFYNKHKGYICKKEDMVQKATGVNLFIRLGSKNYVDYLERKPNAIRP